LFCFFSPWRSCGGLAFPSPFSTVDSSQAVTLKEGHELITSGPYALVRHPIYMGLLLTVLGCAIARGEWRGLVAFAIVFGELWHKLSLEEKWMREQFGESYTAYSQRVSTLVPI